MSSAYLPKNQTGFEQAVADAGAFREVDPDLIRLLYDVDQCPPDFLSFLAWMLSVDFWEMAATDEQRRNLVRGAIQWHRKRGTPWAVKQALTAFQFGDFELDDDLPDAHWAEFDVLFTVKDRPVTENTYAQVARVINEYKPERSKLRRLRTALNTTGNFAVGCITVSGEVLTVMPLTVSDVTARPAVMKAAAATQEWATTTVYPRSQ